mgnify:CR=1 FL=1
MAKFITKKTEAICQALTASPNAMRSIFLIAALICAPFAVQAEDLKIEKGARLFARQCAMGTRNMEARAVEIIREEYDGKGFVFAGEHTISGKLEHAILTYNTPAYTKSGRFECSVHAFNVDKATAINAWFSAFAAAKPGSVRLTRDPNLAKRELAKWKVSGIGTNATLVAQSIKRGGALLKLSWN